MDIKQIISIALQSFHITLATAPAWGITKWLLEFTAKEMRPPLPSSWGRIHAPRRESSQCPAQLATSQQSPLAPWPWLWVCRHSHGTAQNRLLLITQDREPGEEGGVVVVVVVDGWRWWWWGGGERSCVKLERSNIMCRICYLWPG